MTLVEQTFAQAVLLSGTEDARQSALLSLLCQSAVSTLTQRMRDGLTPEDCKADFVAAGALYALAALSEADEISNLERIQIGDVTLQPGSSSAAARCLRNQASLMMSPYLKESFSFRGV